MAKNLLIDTCVWKQLIAKLEYSKYLKQLITWAEHGYITLYCPATLQEEWIKHREVELNNLERALKKHVQDIKKLNLLTVPIEIGEAELSHADELLKSQILGIDRLLDDAVNIPEGPPEALLARTHKKQRKAPFVNKIDSDNDALLIFSTLEELDRSGETELIFFSANKNEFGDPKDILHSIHPDIEAIKPGIKIKYFCNYPEGIDYLINCGLPSEKVPQNKLNNVKMLINVDRSVPLLDQLHEYLDKRFKDIRILPQHLFYRHYPFITTEKFAFYPQPFTALTNNEELFELFRQIPAVEGIYKPNPDTGLGTEKETERKVTEILKCLRGNFIHHASTKNEKVVDLPQVADGVNCGCPLCQYRDFNFSVTLNALKLPLSDTPDLKDAYTFYVVGKFHKASEILKQVAERALSEEKFITYFISQYNLCRLGWHLAHNTLNDAEDRELINELKATDIDDAFVKSKTHDNKEILTYIQQAAFVKKATENVQSLVTKIREDFYTENNGWNNQTRELLGEYFVADSFLQYNYVMYDEFSQYSDLSNLFVEGLFASYACPETLGGKLLFFTDPIVERIIMHGNHKHIRTMFHRFKLRSLKYESADDPGSFVLMFVRLLNDYEAIVEAYKEFNTDGKANMVFWNKYRRYFQNSLTMAAILELTQESVTLITDSLIRFIDFQKHVLEIDLTATLDYYLYHKNDFISDDQLIHFLWMSFTSDDISGVQLIEDLGKIAHDRHIILEPNEDQWEIIKDRYLQETTFSANDRSMGLLCELYILLKDNIKKTFIGQFIIRHLTTSFDASIYYHAVMHDMIPLNREWSLTYDGIIMDVIEKGKGPRPFARRAFYTDSRVDEYINYTFKYRIQLNAGFVERVTALGDYYRWITNVDGYDYETFDTAWLFNYYSMFHKETYKSSTRLKNHLLALCRRSDDHPLLRLFIDVYHDEKTF